MWGTSATGSIDADGSEEWGLSKVDIGESVLSGIGDSDETGFKFKDAEDEPSSENIDGTYKGSESRDWEEEEGNNPEVDAQSDLILANGKIVSKNWASLLTNVFLASRS